MPACFVLLFGLGAFQQTAPTGGWQGISPIPGCGSGGAGGAGGVGHGVPPSGPCPSASIHPGSVGRTVLGRLVCVGVLLRLGTLVEGETFDIDEWVLGWGVSRLVAHAETNTITAGIAMPATNVSAFMVMRYKLLLCASQSRAVADVASDLGETCLPSGIHQEDTSTNRVPRWYFGRILNQLGGSFV